MTDPTIVLPADWTTQPENTLSADTFVYQERTPLVGATTIFDRFGDFCRADEISVTPTSRSQPDDPDGTNLTREDCGNDDGFIDVTID